MIEEIEEKIPMSKKYEYLDSSDDELEVKVLNNIKADKSYVKYILNNFGLHGVTFKDFTINLALAVHNFADRVFKNSEINKQYKNHKSQIFKDGHSKLLFVVEDFVKENNDIELIKNLDPIKIFDTLLDINCKALNSVHLSDNEQFILNKFQEYKKVKKIDFFILAQNPLVLSLESSSADLLSFSKLVSRNNKNTIKSYILENIESNITNISYKIPVSSFKTLSEYHVIKNNGNAHSLIPEFGTYDSILSKIPKEFENRQIFIDNVFKLIKNQEPKNDLHNNDTKHLDERIVHLLFITEMQRNNAVLFTAPIFLKLLLNSDEKIEFPMSVEDAVSHCRGIFKEYKDILPNHSYIDYDNKNISKKIKVTDFLFKEGKLIVQFVKGIKVEKAEQFNFDKFFTKLEHAEFLKMIIATTDISKISPRQINDTALYIKIQNPFFLTIQINQEIQIFSKVIDIITQDFGKIRPSVSTNQDLTELLKNLKSIEGGKKSITGGAIEGLRTNIDELYKLFSTICENLQKNQVVLNNITQIIPTETEGCITSIFQELLINMKDCYDISLNNEFSLLGNTSEMD